MAKYIIEYGIPAILLGTLTWWGLRVWYLKYFGTSVKRHREMKKATDKYEKELNR